MSPTVAFETVKFKCPRESHAFVDIVLASVRLIERHGSGSSQVRSAPAFRLVRGVAILLLATPDAVRRTRSGVEVSGLIFHGHELLQGQGMNRDVNAGFSNKEVMVYDWNMVLRELNI